MSSPFAMPLICAGLALVVALPYPSTSSLQATSIRGRNSSEESRASVATRPQSTPESEGPSTIVDWSTAECIRAVPALKKLQPARTQEELPAILDKVGKNVATLFSSFPNTSSREKVIQEILRPDGSVRESSYQEFYYLVLADPAKDATGFKEYRTDKKGKPTDLATGYLLTQGFASTSMIFHSRFQSDSRFRYLGRQVMDKRETEVVAFAQKPTAREGATFVASGKVTILLAQGVAWIDPANYQIIRLRTGLLVPHGEIKLRREDTDIRFGEVSFKEAAAPLWLPRRIVVEIEWQGVTSRNTHLYSDFKLFSVETEQKQKAPEGGQ